MVHKLCTYIFLLNLNFSKIILNKEENSLLVSRSVMFFWILMLIMWMEEEYLKIDETFLKNIIKGKVVG